MLKYDLFFVVELAYVVLEMKRYTITKLIVQSLGQSFLVQISL